MGDSGDSGLESCPVQVCNVVQLLREIQVDESSPAQIAIRGLFWAIHADASREIAFTGNGSPWDARTPFCVGLDPIIKVRKGSSGTRAYRRQCM
jgi:hypothetical protein